MGTMYSLDDYRRRRGRRLQSPAGVWTDSRVAAQRAGLPALLGEAVAPTCGICGQPIVVSRGADPFEARALRNALVREGLCASCFAPF